MCVNGLYSVIRLCNPWIVLGIRCLFTVSHTIALLLWTYYLEIAFGFDLHLLNFGFCVNNSGNMVTTKHRVSSEKRSSRSIRSLYGCISIDSGFFDSVSVQDQPEDTKSPPPDPSICPNCQSNSDWYDSLACHPARGRTCRPGILRGRIFSVMDTSDPGDKPSIPESAQHPDQTSAKQSLVEDIVCKTPRVSRHRSRRGQLGSKLSRKLKTLRGFFRVKKNTKPKRSHRHA